MSKLKTWQIIVIALLGLCSFCGVCFTGMAVLDYMGFLSTEVPESIAVATNLPLATSLPSILILQPSLTPTILPTLPELPTNTPQPLVSTTQTSKLGETVTGHGYSLSGIAVEDPVTENDFAMCEVKPNEKIIAVQIVVENISGDALYTVNPLNFSLVDKEGFVYVSAQCNVDGVEGLKDIQPGQKDRRWVTFIIPMGSTAASIRWNIDYGNRFLIAGLIP